MKKNVIILMKKEDSPGKKKRDMKITVQDL